MKRILTVAAAAVLAVGLAACQTITPAPDGTTPTKVPPIAATAPESPYINQACRADLNALPPAGPSLVNTADVDLGYWAAEGKPADDPEVMNTLSAFRWAAVQAGAVSCGD